MDDVSRMAAQMNEKLYRENVVENNRRCSLALLTIGMLYVLLPVLEALHVYTLGIRVIGITMCCIGLINAGIYLFARRTAFSHRYLQFLILLGITVSSGFVFFFYPLTAAFITYGPILVSATYYNTRLIKRTSFCSWLLYALLLWSNVLLEASNETMRAFHAFQEFSLWSMPEEVLMNLFIPQSIFFAVTTFIFMGMVEKGKSLLAKRSAMAAEMAIVDSEVKIAAEVQQASLPEKQFASPDKNLSVRVYIRPAKDVCGDFYDYFVRGDDCFFLIADVSDKGIPAAMFMMKAKTALRSALLTAPGLREAVVFANDILCDENGNCMFVTLWMARLNLKTGVGEYVNCGHLPPMVKHGDGSVTMLENIPCLMLGAFEDAVYPAYPFILESTDTLLLFTDGLTDAMNRTNEPFGEKRLRQAAGQINAAAEDFCSELMQYVDAYADSERQFDDITLMSLRLRAPQKPHCEELSVSAAEEAAGAIMDRVNGVLAEYGCPESIRRSIDVVIDELYTNITDYALDAAHNTFTVSFTVSEGFFRFVTTDSGAPFNPLEYQSAPAEELPIGGLGISLIRELSDKTEYSYENGCNRFVFYKVWPENDGTAAEA